VNFASKRIIRSHWPSLCNSVTRKSIVLELFKPSNDLASFPVCNEEHLLGFGFFVGDVVSGFEV